MKRVLLVANTEKHRALELAETARRFLESRDVRVLGIATGRDDALDTEAADLIVVFGGDGTVLNAARRLGDRTTPLLTVNLGRLGYLAEVGPDELEETLQRVLDGSYRISERMLLHGRILRDGKEIWHGHAVNEFVITPAQTGRILQLDIRVEGRMLTRLSGDGLILATPTGSTAYALSAGGPVVCPEMRAMIFVPICPHHLGNRPLVMGEHEVLTIRPVEGDNVGLIADGRETIPLAGGAEVEIKASTRVFRMILGEELGRYDILRMKLGWGGEA